MFQTLLKTIVELIVGLASGLVVIVFLAMIFWFLWNYLGIGGKYFPFLPPLYLGIGFWDTVGVFVVLDILKSAIFPSLSVKIEK